MFAAAVLASLGACSSGAETGVAARVGDAEIRGEEVEELTDAWLASTAAQQAEAASAGMSRREAEQFMLTSLIRAALLRDLAAKHGVPPAEDELESLVSSEIPAEELAAGGWTRDEFAGAMRNGRLAQAIAEQLYPTVEVADVEVRRKYDRHAAMFGEGWSAEVDIATFTADPGLTLRRRVAAGEGFTAAARAAAATEVADLGTVSHTSPLPEPVLAAIAGLTAGEASHPVRAEEGFLVAYVRRRDPQPAVGFDQARAEIVRLLEDEKRQELFARWFDGQLRQAQVEVDGRYGKWDTEYLMVE